MTATNISALQKYLQQQPPLNVASQRFEYLDGRVLSSLTATGDVTYTVDAATFMRRSTPRSR